MTYEFIHPCEFIYPVTYEFIYPAKCMNSYVSDPCLVYKMATHGGGGVVGGVTATIATADWSRVQIPKTWIHFFLANLANFHVATILANLYMYKT
jgi:hypothetical protein